jgi:hypothetical protein
MKAETHDLLEQIIICGRFPRRANGEIDLYKVNNLLKEIDDTNHRISVLRRLMTASVGVVANDANNAHLRSARAS